MKAFWLGAATSLAAIVVLIAVWFIFGFLNDVNNPDPQNYTKDKAAGQAMEKLVRYAEAHHVPVYQFKGPYFSDVLGQDFALYAVCYKHPKHHFCYDHWTNTEDSGPVQPGEKKSERMKWLERQPD
jgi:hypothetical protein